MAKELLARLETKLEAEKEQNYFASVFMGDSEIVEYLTQLPNNIERLLYVVKRNHHVHFPRFKWIEDPCNLFS